MKGLAATSAVALLAAASAVALLAAASSVASSDSTFVGKSALIDRAMTYIREFNQNAAFSGLFGTDQPSTGRQQA